MQIRTRRPRSRRLSAGGPWTLCRADSPNLIRNRDAARHRQVRSLPSSAHRQVPTGLLRRLRLQRRLRRLHRRHRPRRRPCRRHRRRQLYHSHRRGPQRLHRRPSYRHRNRCRRPPPRHGRCRKPPRRQWLRRQLGRRRGRPSHHPSQRLRRYAPTLHTRRHVRGSLSQPLMQRHSECNPPPAATPPAHAARGARNGLLIMMCRRSSSTG